MPDRKHSRFILAAAVAITAATQSPLAHLPASWGQSVASEPIASDVPGMRQTLFDPASRQDQRDQAAERLLSRPGQPAREAILAALQQVDQPAVQLAAVRALGEQPATDPNLINPLFALLSPGSSEAVINGAAKALTAFKGDDSVVAHLLSLTKDNDDRVRVACIRAAGTYVDPHVAEALIALLDPNTQSPAIVTAAGDALGYLSGLDPTTTTADGWRKWWNDNKAKSATQFRADVAQARSQRYDKAESSVSSLKLEFQRVLTDQYQRLPTKDQKADTLLRYLRSTEPAMRVVGCQIVHSAAANAELPPSAVKEQLRVLVGDASADVRRESADALALMNDAGALMPLLTQLNQEIDARARAAQINALRPIGDVRAAPLELAMLDDASIDVVQAAAGALGDRDFGPRLRQQNPALADEAAQKLLQTVQARTTPHDNIDLRYTLVQATVPLRSKSLAQPYLKMLQQPEAPRVRRELLNALGEMRDPQLADSIASSLNDGDTGVQLAAVRALGKSIDALSGYDRQLQALIEPANHAPPEVQKAAWDVITALFAKSPTPQLTQWQNYSAVKNDPAKLLVLLKELRSRDRAEGNDENAALRNQQIGDQSRAVGQWQDAIVAYQDAHTYATQMNKGYMIEQIDEGLVKAYLASHQYDVAVNFVQGEIKSNGSLEDTLGSVLRQEAEKLVNSNKDYDSALQLINQVLNMKPALRPQSTQMLQDLRSQVEHRSREQNFMPFPLRRSENA